MVVPVRGRREPTMAAKSDMIDLSHRRNKDKHGDLYPLRMVVRIQVVNETRGAPQGQRLTAPAGFV
jgi:hypothetical protein